MFYNEFYNEIVLSQAEYKILKEVLEKHGVYLTYSCTDGKTYKCYIRNPYREAVNLYGSIESCAIVKNEAEEYFARYKAQD